PLPPIFCTVASHTIALSALGIRLIDTGAGNLIHESEAISSNGRFLVMHKDFIDQSTFPLVTHGPVDVIDVFNQLEALTASDGSHDSRFGHISDDGTLVAPTSTAGGWYEYAP